MAGSKEIRNQIKSVRNTQKITSAMEMVAAAKRRKAQDRMKAARPYAEHIRQVAAHLAASSVSDYKHPFLIQREQIKATGLIVVTADKGLCGSLNSNILRLALEYLQNNEKSGLLTQTCVFGNKGYGLLARTKVNIAAYATDLGDVPKIEQLIGPIKVMLDAYHKGEIDRLDICYMRFVNTMKQEAVLEQLLPIPPKALEPSSRTRWEYIYEPSGTLVVEEIMVRYIESIIYHAVAENMASEQSARMVAMKAASDNAESLIDDLVLLYNKSRQAQITQELSEIVAGAAAV